MMVVSEIGEQWSPHTAPAMHAEIEIIIMFSLLPEKTATTIGIKMPKVPQEVPVAKARKHPTRKMIAGRNFNKLAALEDIIPATKAAAPRLSVIAFNVQARVRIRIAGTIALKPSGIHAIDSLNLRTLRTA